MKRKNTIENIFSRKKCIFNNKKLKFVNINYLFLQNTNNLSNHKLLFSCNYKTKIYKVCDPYISLTNFYINTRAGKLSIYREKKLNLLIKSMPTFKYKRLFYIFSDVQKYLKNNIKHYTNTYIDLFLLKSIFFRNYDSISNVYANDSLFYEYCLDHENDFNDFFFFDNIYTYYCKYLFFERFNCIKFNSACFDNNIKIFFDKQLDSNTCEYSISCNNYYDFFYLKTKDIKFNNFYFSGHIILFPKNRQEYIDSSLGFDDDEIEAQNLFFNKYKLVDDFVVLQKPYFFDTSVLLINTIYIYNVNNYKFLNFFFLLKLFNNN